jgi:uncharacterized protein YdaU (DUF1376 family)
MSAPYFPLYADDFLAGTMDLGPDEVGAYIRLLCHQWNRGSLPADVAKLKRVAGGGVSADVLAKFSPGPDGLLRNARLEKVRADMQAFRDLQSEKGKRSAEARRNRGSTAVQPRLPAGEASAGAPVDGSAENRLEPKSNFPLPLPLPEKNYALGGSLPTAPQAAFEAATNHPASEDDVARHFEALAPGVFARELIHAAWLSFEADAVNGQWMWGRRPVSDWRAAFERRLGDLRAKNGAEKTPAKTVSASVRAIATREELETMQADLDQLPHDDFRKEQQAKLDARWRELEVLEGGK